MQTRIKSIFFLIIAFFPILFQAVCAQNQIGIIGGMNYSTSKYSNHTQHYNESSIFGYILSFVFDLNIKSTYYITMQPRIIKKGDNTKNINGFPWKEINSRFSYFELPIYFKKKFEGRIFNPYLNTGINIGYLYSATSERKNYYDTSRINVKNQYKNYDFALDIGAGIEILLKPKFSIILDIRYSNGLSNIAKEGTLKFTGDQFTVGFLYDL